MTAIIPRVVLITRETEYEMLLTRHATRGQAAFFLHERGQTLEVVEQRHQRQYETVRQIQAALPVDWRRNLVKRHELNQFIFEPEDLVVAVGQDGLVANVAKYLDGQYVLGVNPDQEYFDGILVPFSTEHAVRMINDAMNRNVDVEKRTMVAAKLDDGQQLLALNELFVGHRSHQSARYMIQNQHAEEHHSSSGVIITTGTGATGWAQSIHRERSDNLRLPGPEEEALAFYVREAFPSKVTGTALTAGRIASNESLTIRSENNDGGVIFGDGIEDDYLSFNWGMQASFTIASNKLALVMA